MGFALLVEGYCRLRKELKRTKDENEKLKAELKQRGTRDTFSAGKRQEAHPLDRPSKQMRLGMNGLY